MALKTVQKLMSRVTMGLVWVKAGSVSSRIQRGIPILQREPPRECPFFRICVDNLVLKFSVIEWTFHISIVLIVY